MRDQRRHQWRRVPCLMCSTAADRLSGASKVPMARTERRARTSASPASTARPNGISLLRGRPPTGGADVGGRCSPRRYRMIFARPGSFAPMSWTAAGQLLRDRSGRRWRCASGLANPAHRRRPLDDVESVEEACSEDAITVQRDVSTPVGSFGGPDHEGVAIRPDDGGGVRVFASIGPRGASTSMRRWQYKSKAYASANWCIL